MDQSCHLAFRAATRDDASFVRIAEVSDRLINLDLYLSNSAEACHRRCERHQARVRCWPHHESEIASVVLWLCPAQAHLQGGAGGHARCPARGVRASQEAKGNNVKRSWEKIDKVTELYMSGLSTRQIAEKSGVSKSVVGTIVKQAGISRDRSSSQIVGCKRKFDYWSLFAEQQDVPQVRQSTQEESRRTRPHLHTQNMQVARASGRSGCVQHQTKVSGSRPGSWGDMPRVPVFLGTHLRLA
jgi:hypothetical protein